MPELCRFYDITIYINFRDHNPPHIHAVHGEHEVVVDINTLRVEGRLRMRERRPLIRWASLHQDELRAAWERAQRYEPPGKIAPLE
ncbi:MAG: DUF4160 domain-containing protein [Chloroflexi bacterium]|nr:DUF4160 domain-containing protein [Chloroflexota bacterium]